MDKQMKDMIQLLAITSVVLIVIGVAVKFNSTNNGKYFVGQMVDKRQTVEDYEIDFKTSDGITFTMKVDKEDYCNGHIGLEYKVYYSSDTFERLE